MQNRAILVRPDRCIDRYSRRERAGAAAMEDVTIHANYSAEEGASRLKGCPGNGSGISFAPVAEDAAITAAALVVTGQALLSTPALAPRDQVGSRVGASHVAQRSATEALLDAVAPMPQNHLQQQKYQCL